MELRITVGGDPEGGWLVDVHDGDRSAVYRPDASHVTTADAAMGALCEHFPHFVEALLARDTALIKAAQTSTVNPPGVIGEQTAAPSAQGQAQRQMAEQVAQAQVQDNQQPASVAANDPTPTDQPPAA